MLKVGIAGLRRGQGLYFSFKHCADAEVTAVCDTNKQIAEDFGKANQVPKVYSDLSGFLRSGIDIAVLATPAPLHVDHAIEALDAGKHVLSEVPAAMEMEGCKKLVKAVRKAQKRGLKYMMAENCNYYHPIMKWKEWVDAGKLGRIFYAEAEYVHDCRSIMVTADGKPTWRFGFTPLLYPTHSIGPLLMLMQDRLTLASGFSTGIEVSPELKSPSMEVGIFKTKKGAVVKILCGFSIEREPSHLYYSLYGTNGSVETNRFNIGETRVYIKGEHKTMTAMQIPLDDPDAPAEAKLGGHGTSEYYLVRDFLRSVLKDTKPPVDIYDAMDYTAPGICAHISARNNGRPVSIPDFREE